MGQHKGQEMARRAEHEDTTKLCLQEYGHSRPQTSVPPTCRMCPGAVGQWAPVPSGLFPEGSAECRHRETPHVWF